MERSFFDGLPPRELALVLGELERRRYPAGAVLIAEGDKPNEIMIVQAGHAEVFLSDRNGIEHRVGHVGPGASLGEMSLFTGQPASGVVRAATNLDVLIMKEPEFERLATRHPLVYRNLGTILSERLARTNRLALRDATGQLTLLVDDGGPPELAWALAASVAWHTRTPTLLISIGDAVSAAVVAQLEQEGATPPGPRAHLLVLPAAELALGRSLEGRLEDLFATYSHILILRREGAPAIETPRVFHLTGTDGTPVGGRKVVCAWRSTGAATGRERNDFVSVPPLEARDLDALRAGRLPVSTPAGSALGRVARDIAGLKVGLALGAGSLRGYAHFGALHALQRLGIPLDYVAGTSVGALAAGLHAVGLTPAESISAFDRSGSFIFRPTVSTRGMLTNRPLGKYFRSVLGENRIEDLRPALAVVAADLDTQSEIVFRSGLLWLALLASMSIPGIYPAMRVGGHTVADGGILNPVPSTVAAGMGADIVVAVKLSGGAPPPQVEAEAVATPGRRPSSIGVLLRAVEVMYSRLATDLTDTTMVAIAPDLPDLPGAKLRNFTQGSRYVEAGANAVQEALPRLTAAMPWLGR